MSDLDECRELSDRAWNAVGPAFLTSIFFGLMAVAGAALMLAEDYVGGCIVIGIGLVVAFPFWRAWRLAILACENKTQEMRLQRRQ